MLDTSKTAGKTAPSTQQEASGPGFDWLLIAAAALAVAVLGAIVWNIAQNDEPTVDTDSMVSGFEHNTDATTGKVVTGFVTSQYFGHSGELFPEEGAAAETPVQWTPPEYRGDYRPAAETPVQWTPVEYWGDYGETNAVAATKPFAGFEDTTEHTTGKVASAGVTTPYFGFNPEFD